MAKPLSKSSALRPSIVLFSAALLVCLSLEPPSFAVALTPALAAVTMMPQPPLAPGEEVWLKRYQGRENSDNLARAMVVSPDGTKVFVTGNSGPGNHVSTIAYSEATGETLWTARYNTFTEAQAMAVSPDGSRVFVTGDIGERSADYLTIAYDSSTRAGSS